MKALASTEHGLPKGWVSKKLACDEAGIKFLHGVEIYLTESLEPKVRDNYHTILIAKNQAGVEELNTIVTKSSDDKHFYYTNRISFEEFLGLSGNIITTSACLASPLNKLPEENPWYSKLVQRYDYLEVQPHISDDQAKFNRRLSDLSKQYGKPLIVGTDTHSASRYKAECREILLLAKHKSYGDEDELDLTFKSYGELVQMFKQQGALTNDEVLEAMKNTNRLADSCEDFSLDKSIKYPILNGSREEDEAVFEKTVWEMFEDKLSDGVIPREQEHGFRVALDEELRVFRKLHMSGFMLSMSELVRWCKANGMAIGTARGSVGGSRAAYVTDIIDLNPEQWHTVFSRFANEDRIEIGDIDIDVVYEDRPQIFEHMIERFGKDNTARVSAYGTLADKAPIVEIFRALKLSRDEERYSNAELERAKELFQSDPDKARSKYPEVFYYYDGLIGTKVSQSVHPAGMVISPISLGQNYGTFSKDGEICLLLDMDEAHEVGLAKYDFLALKTVKVIRDACAFAGISYPKTHEVDFCDKDVWGDMLRSPFGVFQFEKQYAFDNLRTFGARSISDMSLVTAAIRPSGASYRNDLMARRIHSNPSELIDNLLVDNLGYLIYQEDTIKFLQQVCGLSGSEADNIRRAIGRKQKDRLDAAMPSILDGYCKKSPQPREVAEQEAKEFLQVIEDSASYQFGYNHSIAYCILGYYCAYMRYYYPIEFITSFLNNAANDDDIVGGTKLAKLYGIKITNPKWGISRREYFFDKDKKVIAKGLASVKYIGGSVADNLYELSQEKDFNSFMELLYDLTERTGINSRQIEILIKIDFFSQFGNQRELLRLMELFTETFNKGQAKKLKKSSIDGTPLESIVAKHSVGVTKSGGEAKSYTILDVMSIMREVEQLVLSLNMSDLDDVVKIQNFYDVMGYLGYMSNREEDRRKLFLTDVKPLCRKADGKQFGYSFFTKSIGSGVEARFTVLNWVFKKCPVNKGDIILLNSYQRDGAYFKLTDYGRIT